MVSQLDIAPTLNHVAIQTDDVQSTISWYEKFIGASVEWSLDTFSPLTNERLPGIRKLVELKTGDVRFHVFDRAQHTQQGPPPLDFQFQHVGLAVQQPHELVELRERWLRLRASEDFRWHRDEPPSDIVVDDEGMQSLYVLDPNGLELEFVYFPGNGA